MFPAPVERRTLIHYRWINTQLRILFTSAILALLSAGWGFVPGNAAIRLVGWWLILSTLDLHAVASSFAITRLLDRGITSLRRSLITLAIAAALLIVALVATGRALHAPGAEDLAGPATLGRYFASLLSTRPLSWLLLPAKWVVQPLLAADARGFMLALGPAALVYAVHYAWVLRAEVAFEEASIAKAEQRAARRNAARRDGTWRIGRSERKAQRAPFELAALGRPELAFLWKNLLSSAPYLRLRTAIVAAIVVLIVCSGLARADVEPLPALVGMLALVGAGYTLVFGPMIARQDLRADLPNADLLKTYPLRGWQIVLGEVLTPIAIVTALLWLFLLAAALTFHPPRVSLWSTGVQAAAAVGAGVLLPFLCAIEVLVMNSAVLLFPAWVARGAERPSGIDVLGQRIFFVAGLFLTVAAALLPAAVAAALVFLVAWWFLGGLLAAVLAVVAALVALIMEIALVVVWLGRRFERFDLSAELKP